MCPVSSNNKYTNTRIQGSVALPPLPTKYNLYPMKGLAAPRLRAPFRILSHNSSQS